MENIKKISLHIEIAAYVLLTILCIVAAGANDSLFTVLLIYLFVLAQVYIFLFGHWFEADKSLFMKVFGIYVYTLLPLSLIAISQRLAGSEIIALWAGVHYIVYWLVRIIRKTAKFRSSLHLVWAVVLFVLIPVFYMLFNLNA